MGKSERFPRGKQAAAEPRYPTLIFPRPVYAVFLCDHTTGCQAYMCATDGYGIHIISVALKLEIGPAAGKGHYR